MKEDRTKQAVALFDKYALKYEAQYMSVEKYHDSLNLFCDHLSSEEAYILELACGPGNLTQYIRSKKPLLKILATDLSSAMLELAAKNNPSADTLLLDCRALTSLEKIFDAIVCGFILPYLSKEEALQMISDASSMLNPNGLLYISTMEKEYGNSGYKGSSDNPDEGLYTYYHEAGYLEKAFVENGLEVVHISRVKYSDHAGEVVDLIIVGKK